MKYIGSLMRIGVTTNSYKGVGKNLENVIGMEKGTVITLYEISMKTEDNIRFVQVERKIGTLEESVESHTRYEGTFKNKETIGEFGMSKNGNPRLALYLKGEES